ncbi:MAG: beta-ketoacyl-[acyl-carrier-protein] synthase family protein [Chloroflexi bacterium]|nr:beta-ketoacyl-[acyl-carrier-protein] synthase family protein [Chloroflexota bacterium]
MSATRRRVVITGIGALTPIGSGPVGLWRGVTDGQSAVGRVTRFDATPFRARLAAEVSDFDAAEFMDARRVHRLERYSQLAVAASLQAASDAGLRECLPREAGCYIGSALGGVAYGEAQHRLYLQGGAGSVSPNLALSVFGGAAPANVAMALGLHGPIVANANSCASGAVAVGEAFRLIRSGEAEVMLAGGVEAPLAPLTFGSFAAINAMSTANDQPASASRPFDARRDGFVMSEGAGVLVLEDLEHASARHAPHIYAELRGYGATNDAHNMLAPRPDGEDAARAMCLALEDARVWSSAVEYVNAHASSTPIGDRAEATAIRRALGRHGTRVPVSGTKGLHGHPLGASAGIEVAITALALCHEFLPGTANFQSSEPDLGPLNVLDPRGRTQSFSVAIKNAFGFGGINATLVLSRV